MSNNNEYNGWQNYETWNVNLWIQNNESIYFTVRDGLADLRADREWEDVSIDAVKQVVRDAFSSDETPDGVSLMSSAIDWNEIFDAIREFVNEEEIADERNLRRINARVARAVRESEGNNEETTA